ATVNWNGNPLATTFVSTTQLSASVPAADIASPGAASVTVSQYGQTSYAYTFNITNPAPVLSAINPTSASAGGPDFTLTVTGQGFVNNSAVKWNGTALATTFVSAATLTASVPAALIATAGTAKITVFSPAPGGGTSASKTFTIQTTSAAVTGAQMSTNSGSYQAAVAIQNTGYNTAVNLTITRATLNGVLATNLPQLVGNVAVGAKGTGTLHFPGSAGRSGSVVKLSISGKFKGGRFRGVLKVTLP
ncbi:MAG TPA: IPT/TIG domain-containing protein, partial [Chthonomonadaceae bacterium]|nr:IPT/TIG domain-containing protein [Chthonomonadaceae bacterium]